jgi:hypothetical protein
MDRGGTTNHTALSPERRFTANFERTLFVYISIHDFSGIHGAA